MMNLRQGVKSRLDALKSRLSRKALVSPKAVETKPTVPRVETKTIEWQAPEQLIDLGIHEQLINAKRNRAHDKRMQMKKFHKKQAKMNHQYRMKG